MVIELDMESEVPIYVQLRNQIVKGIGKGELKAQEKLPTVRQLEAELELLSAEASITGMEKAEFLKLCDGIYSKMKVCRQY